MELTIAMLLSAIVISITYTAYTIINKTFFSFVTKNSELAELSNLDNLIKRDFLKSDHVVKDTMGLTFEIDSQYIHYRFYPDYTIRASAIQDTFRFKTMNILLSFEGNEQSKTTTGNDSLVDALSFRVVAQRDSVDFAYRKQYSSTTLLNLNSHAIN